MSSNKELIIKVIELYKDSPCLWQSSDPDYHNKNKRSKALDKMVELYRSQDQVATRELVNKKIHSLRGAYRKELNKIKASKISGAEEEHVPKLWYYNLMTFLEDQDPKSSQDAGDVEYSWDGMSQISIDNARESSPTISERSFKRRRTKIDTILSKISKRLDSPPSAVSSIQTPKQYDVFGMYIAEQLRSIPPHVVPICKKLISDVIYLAETGVLNNSSRITTATM